MIRTVTFNTGFDEMLVTTSPDEGGVAQILSRSLLPSGKGVNCARVLRALGAPVTAYGLIGTDAHVQFTDALQAQGIRAVLVPVPAPTRRNVTISCAAGGADTHYRAPGFALQNGDPIAALLATLTRDIQDGDIVSLHGSTPEGAHLDSWSKIANVARSHGAEVVVDVNGEPLTRVLRDGPVAVCKPNQQEMRVLPGVNGNANIECIRAALRHMVAANVRLPIVSMGEAGIAFAALSGMWMARLPAERQHIRVGAGDASVAGVAAAMSRGETNLSELVRAAIATAVAHVEGVPSTHYSARVAQIAPRVSIERAGDL
jgi:1-phosphofructokinase